jgi:hypothetical protein
MGKECPKDKLPGAMYCDTCTVIECIMVKYTMVKCTMAQTSLVQFAVVNSAVQRSLVQCTIPVCTVSFEVHDKAFNTLLAEDRILRARAMLAPFILRSEKT